MTVRDDQSTMGAARVLDREEVEGVLSGAFYAPYEGAASSPVTPVDDAKPPRRANGAEKPAHYKVICISMYTKDLERLDAMVDALKERGLTKANRSALIRAALDQIDLEKVPRGM